MIRGCWAVAVAVGLTGGALFASPAGAAPSQTSATSTAWAGYVDAGETFTSVSAHQPSCAATVPFNPFTMTPPC